MLVVFYHYGLIFSTLQTHGLGEVPALLRLGNLQTFGAAGVPIFFVISGFVIGIKRFDPSLRAMRKFVIGRLIRLVPLYWTMTLIWAFALPYKYALADIFASLGFVQLMFGGLPIIQPGWSLEYEMFFYATFAVFVTSGLFAKRDRGIIALLCLFILLFGLNWTIGLTAYGSPLIFEFAAGLFIARIHHISVVSKFWPVYLLAALGLFLLSNLTGQDLPLIYLLWGGGAFFLVLGLVGAEVRGWALLSTGALRQLGEASYAIYLSHTFLVSTLFVWPLWHWQLQRLFEPHVALIMLAAIAALFGWLVHKLCEAPMTKFFRGLTMRGSFKTTPVAPTVD